MSAATTSRASFSRHEITGVVLAGGKGRRMGGVDKGLVLLNGKPMVVHVLTALRPQVGSVIINANRNRDQYAAFGCEVIPDIVGDYFGPLAGIASAMQAVDTKYILTAPCDSPLIGDDLAARLYDGLVRERAEISVAHDGERMQPVFALLQRDLLSSVVAYLEGGERKIDRWFAKHSVATVYFTDRPETFLNVNSPEDRAALEAKLAEVH
ncbi:MAG: molybdenum cofactor guanylyltransferase MobA [Acidiferrobacterales bacterium]